MMTKGRKESRRAWKIVLTREGEDMLTDAGPIELNSGGKSEKGGQDKLSKVRKKTDKGENRERKRYIIFVLRKLGQRKGIEREKW